MHSQQKNNADSVKSVLFRSSFINFGIKAKVIFVIEKKRIN